MIKKRIKGTQFELCFVEVTGAFVVRDTDATDPFTLLQKDGEPTTYVPNAAKFANPEDAVTFVGKLLNKKLPPVGKIAIPSF